MAMAAAASICVILLWVIRNGFVQCGMKLTCSVMIIVAAVGGAVFGAAEAYSVNGVAIRLHSQLAA